jgi:hypothetical protein
MKKKLPMETTEIIEMEWLIKLGLMVVQKKPEVIVKIIKRRTNIMATCNIY